MRFFVFGLMAITNERYHVKFGTEMNHKHTYMQCVKYSLV
jgi:hypothetical protein